MNQTSSGAIEGVALNHATTREAGRGSAALAVERAPSAAFAATPRGRRCRSPGPVHNAQRPYHAGPMPIAYFDLIGEMKNTVSRNLRPTSTLIGRLKTFIPSTSVSPAATASVASGPRRG